MLRRLPTASIGILIVAGWAMNIVAGEPARFERLLSEQLAPDDLHGALR